MLVCQNSGQICMSALVGRSRYARDAYMRVHPGSFHPVPSHPPSQAREKSQAVLSVSAARLQTEASTGLFPCTCREGLIHLWEVGSTLSFTSCPHIGSRRVQTVHFGAYLTYLQSELHSALRAGTFTQFRLICSPFREANRSDGSIFNCPGILILISLLLSINKSTLHYNHAISKYRTQRKNRVRGNHEALCEPLLTHQAGVLCTQLLFTSLIPAGKERIMQLNQPSKIHVVSSEQNLKTRSSTKLQKKCSRSSSPIDYHLPISCLCCRAILRCFRSAASCSPMAWTLAAIFSLP